MENEQILYIDSTCQGNPQNQNDAMKSKLCLNFLINNGLPNTTYAIRLSLQNPSDPSPVIIGFSNPQQADNTKRVLINLSFIINYFFEMKQKLIVEIARNQENFVITTTVGDIIGSVGSSISFPLHQGSQDSIVMSGASIRGDDNILNINTSIPNGSNGLFFVLKKLKPGSQTKEFFAVYKSEISSKQFKSVNIPSSLLTYGNNDNPIGIDLYINNSLSGSAETTINQIMSGKSSFFVGDFNMNFTVQQSKNQYKTFLQYLNQNLQLNLEIAIDFTGSNGAANKSNSLHYLGNQANLYEMAIRECGDIVAAYDSDKIFPVYGFGAAKKGTNNVSHCFPLNLTNDPNIAGIDSILTTYRQVVPQLTFSGPTNFSPFIRNISAEIKQTMHSGFNYHIMLILTDGAISDIEETIDAIVEASYLPISMIIVGIGAADFATMVMLDADTAPLKSKKTGKTAQRDIVQFVPFRECSNNPQQLAMKVLEEMPYQIEQYFNALGK